MISMQAGSIILKQIADEYNSIWELRGIHKKIIARLFPAKLCSCHSFIPLFLYYYRQQSRWLAIYELSSSNFSALFYLRYDRQSLGTEFHEKSTRFSISERVDLLQLISSSIQCLAILQCKYKIWITAKIIYPVIFPKFLLY